MFPKFRLTQVLICDMDRAIGTVLYEYIIHILWILMYELTVSIPLKKVKD